MSNASEESLTHYGVKGMKWGVRKGKSETGLSRYSGAKIDQNERTRAMLKSARAGESHRVSVALGKKLIGSEKWESNFQQSMKNINAQNSRLRRGKATVADKIDMAFSVTYLELGVSIRPKK